MLRRLSETYSEVGLGSIGDIRECERLADTFMFAPEDYLARAPLSDRRRRRRVALLRRAQQQRRQARSTEHQSGGRRGGNGRNAIAIVVRQLPIKVDVVLGSWKMSIRELQPASRRRQIVLPDGEDGWLAAGGVRIRRASIEVAAETAPASRSRSARSP